ncbi:uncharacterized protein LOC133274674 [Pezoporus flaviventris]|uniref:uncharacterized protein LOC133274674 n=1 Tax=Pezoporus flaviventris TaxID=889875 RepID=UPI002AB27995|nr:uncharacterized protein LOC133274674 [Pezoporus flaviventris]
MPVSGRTVTGQSGSARLAQTPERSPRCSPLPQQPCGAETLLGTFFVPRATPLPCLMRMAEGHAASMQFIQTFLESSVKEEAQKIRFLQTVSTLSKDARDEGFTQKLKEFYHRFQVAKNIEALVEEEPVDHLHTAVRQQAMLALAHMSKVEMALGGKKKSLLEACFRSVFLLPPKTDMQGLDNFLYFKTLDAMDILLKSLVLSSPGCKDLRIILQMLLPFTDTKNAAACERAVVRIGKLVDLMDSSSSVQVWSLLTDDNSSSHGDTIHDRLLGQLLGHLIVCWTSKIWEIQYEALDTLHYLCRCIQQQKCKRSCVGLHPSTHRHLLVVLLVSLSTAVDSFCTCWRLSRRDCPLPSPPLPLTAAFPAFPNSIPATGLLQKLNAHHKSSVTSPEDDLKHPQCGGERKAGKPSWLSVCSTRSIVKAFGEDLRPPDKTVILVKAIEAMRDSCTCDKEELISIVDVAMTEPASWLTEVPVIVSCIYNNLEHINTLSVWHTLDMLLLMMAEQWPGDVILRLVHLSPECDSVAMAMWEVLLSQRLILENSLRELSIRFHYLSVPWRFSTYKAEACIQLLALLASSHVTPKMFAGVYEIRKLLMPPRLLSLVLQGLVTLSQSPDSARKILVMLPDLMEALQSAHSDNKMKALLTFRNVIGHLKKKASSIALELAEKLLQLFDDECSQTQELSICLFKDAIQMADWKDKRQMQKKVRRSLVPLMLHMSDEIESVAKASQEAICAAAKVLKWEWLSHHVQTLERWQTVQRLVRTSPRLDTGCSSHLPTLRMLQEAHLGPGSGTGGSQELQTLLCLQLSLNLSPTGLLAGRHTWPEEQGEVWGAGEEGVQPNRQRRGRAAGSVLGSSRSDGALCTGMAARCLKESRADTLLEVCEALHALRSHEESQVSSLASQTIHILTCLHARPRRRWILQALCCCL